ncbi:MAG: lamin tail domain-containing protein, partial [Planctomycetota bacterium]
WSIEDAVGLRHEFPPGTVVRSNCAIVVFGGGSVEVEFNGAETQVSSTGILGLNNGGDTLTLLDEKGVEQARAEYGSEGGNNVALVRDPGDEKFVAHDEVVGSEGALFSPGIQTNGERFSGCPGEPPPPPTSPWVINEVHADPSPDAGDANGDGVISATQDEFIEIVNASTRDASLEGWRISDAAQNRHVFPPETLVPAGCSVVVFGGGTIQQPFTGSLFQLASSGSLGLSNDGDTIQLIDPQGGPQDSFEYGSEGRRDQSLTRSPDIEGEFVLHTTIGSPFSPGTRSDGTPFEGCPAEPPPVDTVEVWEIQGSTTSSPLVDRHVETRNNIVTAVASNGFFIQTPDDRADGDPQTSDGVFVFTNSADVSPRDVVNVEGDITEFFGLTEIVRPTVQRVRSGAPLPTVVIFDATTPSPIPRSNPRDMERFEGMLVRFGGGLVCGPTNDFGEFHAIAFDGDRPFREPGVEFPGRAGLPVYDGNPEVFEVLPGGAGGSGSSHAAGSRVVRCQGVITYRFGDYQLLPTELDVSDDPVFGRPVREPAAGEFSIATQNLLTFVDAINDPWDDDVASPDEVETRVIKAAGWIREYLRSPHLIAFQEVEKQSLLDDVASRIRTAVPSLRYRSFFESSTDPGGRFLGFLVRDDVDVGSMRQVGNGARFDFDGSPRELFSRPPLQLNVTIVENADPVAVINVHLRSRINIEDERFVRAKRFAQATWLAEHIQSLQDQGRQVIVLGDFNAFEFSDGLSHVVGILAGVAAAEELGEAATSHSLAAQYE